MSLRAGLHTEIEEKPFNSGGNSTPVVQSVVRHYTDKCSSFRGVAGKLLTEKCISTLNQTLKGMSHLCQIKFLVLKFSITNKVCSSPFIKKSSPLEIMYVVKLITCTPNRYGNVYEKFGNQGPIHRR
jgi:hypothetical protein